MRRLAVLLIAMFLAAWNSVTTAVDINRAEGDRLWNCVQRYQEVAKATRGENQPGQAGKFYQSIPGDWRRACELAPPAGGGG